MNASADCRRVNRSSQLAKGNFAQRALAFGAVAFLGLGALGVTSSAQAAGGGITSVVIQNTAPAFGGCSIGNIGTFTLVQGYAQDSIDPTSPLNTGITDIALAPKDGTGSVGVVFNFAIILPTSLANFSGRVIADIPNRSGSTLAQPNEASSPAQSAANCSGTYWYPQGYATVDLGWEQDGGGDPTSAQTLPTLNGSFAATGVNSDR